MKFRLSPSGARMLGALALAAIGTARPAAAQTSSPTRSETDKTIEKTEGQVYTYVEQMPQLPGGGGNAAIVRAIQGRVKYPAAALRNSVEGRVFVSFIVGKTGNVRNARIIKGIGGGCDEAVLAAVQELPRFIPGKQLGKPVAVGFTVPVTFQIAEATAAETAADTTQRVYTLVNQMPQLPGGGGNAAIFRAVQQALVVPAEVPVVGQPNKVFISFTVGPSGVVRDAKVVRSLNASCDAAALAAVRQLPRFVGGQLNGRPVSVSYTVPVVFAASVSQP